MNEQTLFILIAILSLMVVAGLFIFIILRGKGKKPLTPLAGLAFALIIAGIVFGEERWLGYGLIGAGVTLACIDMVIKLRQHN